MYGKLFEQMYNGTLGTKGPWQALVTFQQMIILADRNGIVDMTPEVIAKRSTIPLDIILEGIKVLEQPDPGSRTPDEEGRRILRLNPARDWGWRITNHAHYRKIRSEEERREYMRNYQRERRDAARMTRDVNPLNSTSTGVNNVTHAVSSKQEAEASKPNPIVPLARDDAQKKARKTEALQLLEFLNSRAKRHFRPVPANLKFIEARLAEGISLQDLKTMTAKKCHEWVGTDQEAYLRPETLYNATKCHSYLGTITPEEPCNAPAVNAPSKALESPANADGAPLIGLAASPKPA